MPAIRFDLGILYFFEALVFLPKAFVRHILQRKRPPLNAVLWRSVLDNGQPGYQGRIKPQGKSVQSNGAKRRAVSSILS